MLESDPGKRRKPASTVSDTIHTPSAVEPAPSSLTIRFGGALAGIAAAGVSLAVGEFANDLSERVPSLVLSAGEWFIDVVPGGIARSAIELFGTADKLALTVGVVVITLAVGAAVGQRSVHRRLVGDLTFAAFTLIGAWLAARDPLSDTGPSVVAAVVAGMTGWLTLRVLLHRLDVARAAEAPPPVDGGAPALPREDPRRPFASRRAFLAFTGAAGVAAVGTVGVGRALRGRSAAQQARAAVAASPQIDLAPDPDLASTLDGLDDLDAVEGIASYVTPSTDNRFYRIDTALVSPQVDPASWQLDVTGLVDRPYTLTYEEILAMDLVERVVTLSCVSNEVGGELVGNAVWTGVPLAELLDRAGVQAGAEQLFARSVDNFTAGFPVEHVHDGRSALLAVGMNGEPLPIRHGFPARLVVAGLYGYVSAVKWLREIRLTTFDEQGYWVPRGWSQLAPMKTTARIDVPRPSDEVRAGPTAVAGVAWSPPRGIDAVEVSIDGGPWQRARLGGAVSDETWVQWVYEWEATEGDHEIVVRAVDGTGAIQPAGPRPPAPNGAEGWHSRRIRVTA